MSKKSGKSGPGRYTWGGGKLPRVSSPKGIDERLWNRQKHAPAGEGFTKPGSRNPRKAGR